MNEGHVLVAELYALAVRGGGYRLTHRRPTSGSPGVWVIRIYGPPGSRYVMDSEFVPTLVGYHHLNHPHTATITPFGQEPDVAAPSPSGPATSGAKSAPPLLLVGCGVFVVLVVVVILWLTLGR